jgi:tetratricopeptide (TPR) repeat protein
VRGLVLEALGERAAAEAAYGDALACDPEHPESRVNRGSLRLTRGDAAGAAEDASLLAGLHPASEMPWNLRALVASRAGDGAAAAAALAESAARWPSSAAVWQQLGRLLLARGDPGARAALERAAALAPGLPGLQQELQETSGR